MSNKVYTTHDLSIAAFLLMKGQVILRADRQQPGGKYIFEFDDSNSQCRILSMQFLSSECSVYDGYIRTLRGMLNSP